MKMKENETIVKYLDLASEQIMKVTVILFVGGIIGMISEGMENGRSVEESILSKIKYC